MTEDALMMLDHLSPECEAHFETVRGMPDDLGVAYVINPRMVRGLDYYTKTCLSSCTMAWARSPALAAAAVTTA